MLGVRTYTKGCCIAQAFFFLNYSRYTTKFLRLRLVIAQRTGRFATKTMCMALHETGFSSHHDWQAGSAALARVTVEQAASPGAAASPAPPRAEPVPGWAAKVTVLAGRRLSEPNSTSHIACQSDWPINAQSLSDVANSVTSISLSELSEVRVGAAARSGADSATRSSGGSLPATVKSLVTIIMAPGIGGPGLWQPVQ